MSKFDKLLEYKRMNEHDRINYEFELTNELTANINSECCQFYKTPLMKAVDHGYLKMVRLLLSAGANPNLQTRVTLCTALHFAIYEISYNDRHSTEIIQILLEHGANPNLPDDKGNTPLLNAVRILTGKKAVDTVYLLLKYKANPNFQNIKTDYALLIASNKNDDSNVGIIRALLEYAANPILLDNTNTSFLTYYNSKYIIQIINVLLELDIKITIINRIPSTTESLYIMLYEQKQKIKHTNNIINEYCRISINKSNKIDSCEQIIKEQNDKIKEQNDKIKELEEQNKNKIELFNHIIKYICSTK